MFRSDTPCPHFERNQLTEVICQLRFPAILAINNREPADFQDAIRSMFPRYAVRKEQLPPNLIGAGTPGAKLEPPAPFNNHHFISADGKWKLNLTRDFIALSTVSYPGWTKFAGQFDLPLAEFIRIYQPAFFERIGLRYLNVFSRNALGLEHTPWRELFDSAYVGPLAHEDMDERSFTRASVDTEVTLGGSCRARIHSGTGMVKHNAPNMPQDSEPKFILDLDLSMPARTEPRLAAAGLETLHRHATSLFMGATTDCLRDALHPDK